MERSRGVTIFAIVIIGYGTFNLLGLSAYKNFTTMLEGIPHFFIPAIYAFTCFYAMCGIYCGLRILKLEDWARKFMVALTSISVVLGLLLNRTTLANFKIFAASSESQLSPDMVSDAYMYAVILVVFSTIFELALIYFFTRPQVANQFQKAPPQ